jgi:hypothetical protein
VPKRRGVAGGGCLSCCPYRPYMAFRYKRRQIQPIPSFATLRLNRVCTPVVAKDTRNYTPVIV